MQKKFVFLVWKITNNCWEKKSIYFKMHVKWNIRIYIDWLEYVYLIKQFDLWKTPIDDYKAYNFNN